MRVTLHSWGRIWGCCAAGSRSVIAGKLETTMKKLNVRLLVPVALLSVGIVSTGLSAQFGPGRLLVLSKADLMLVVVDPVTLKIIGRVPSGPDPHEVAASADGRTAFISNYGTGKGGFNTLTVADLVTFTRKPRRRSRPAARSARHDRGRRQDLLHRRSRQGDRPRRSRHEQGGLGARHRPGHLAHGRGRRTTSAASSRSTCSRPAPASSNGRWAAPDASHRPPTTTGP